MAFSNWNLSNSRVDLHSKRPLDRCHQFRIVSEFPAYFNLNSGGNLKKHFHIYTKYVFAQFRKAVTRPVSKDGIQGVEKISPKVESFTFKNFSSFRELNDEHYAL